MPFIKRSRVLAVFVLVLALEYQEIAVAENRSFQKPIAQTHTINEDKGSEKAGAIENGISKKPPSGFVWKTLEWKSNVRSVSENAGMNKPVERRREGDMLIAYRDSDDEDAFGDPFDDDLDDTAGFGDSSDDDTNDAAGFGDSEPVESTETQLDSPDPSAGAMTSSTATLSGFFRNDDAIWVERFNPNSNDAVAKLRQSIDGLLTLKKDRIRVVLGAHLAYDFAYQYKRETYEDSTLDRYEFLAQFREAYLSYTQEWIELTFGRQVVVWGEGDILSPLDIVVPVDIREPGLTDPVDWRLPVLMSKVDLFISDDLTFEAIGVHESDFGLLPPPKGTFNPLREEIFENEIIRSIPGIENIDARYKHVPKRFSIKAQQFFLKLKYLGHGFDLSLYAASALDRQGVSQLPPLSTLVDDTVYFELWHPRYTVVGHSGVVTFGSSLIKWELSGDIERPIELEMHDVFSTEARLNRRSLLTGMLGYVFSGIENARLSLEIMQRYIPEDTTQPTLFEWEQPAIALSYNHMLLNQDLRLNAAFILFAGIDSGWLARFDVDYQLFSAFFVGIGYITYQPGKRLGPISGFDEHDRAFLKIRYDFILL